MSKSLRQAELEHAVSVLLDRRWDPIGVYLYGDDDGPEPGTEYGRYASHVVGMLQRGEAADCISHYLMKQATKSMGVGPGPTRTVAETLHTWWKENGGRLPIEP